jgi:hypothetical protein
MLWLITQGGASHQIISCNIFTNEKEGVLYQLWVERPNGKSLKIAENEDYVEVQIIKDAIDYAIEHRIPTLKL